MFCTGPRPEGLTPATFQTQRPTGMQQLLLRPSSQAAHSKLSPAERGDLEVLRLVHEAAQRAPPAAKLCLDQPGPRMRTSLMAACQLG